MCRPSPALEVQVILHIEHVKPIGTEAATEAAATVGFEWNMDLWLPSPWVLTNVWLQTSQGKRIDPWEVSGSDSLILRLLIDLDAVSNWLNCACSLPDLWIHFLLPLCIRILDLATASPQSGHCKAVTLAGSRHKFPLQFLEAWCLVRPLSL
jgi:hypothetical protein